MKHITPLTLSLFLCTYAHANQPLQHTYANTVIAHNIALLAYTTTQSSFNSFNTNTTPNNHPNNHTINAHNLYGHAPMYGTEPLYGEFNDDGTMGRSGGDTPIAALSNIWLDWRHSDNKTKYNNHSPIKNRNDLVIAGLSGNTTRIGSLTHKWGINTGYTNSELNNNIKIDSHGGFVGIFNGFKYDNITLNTNISTGAHDNTTDCVFGSDNFTNFWINGAANLSYNLMLDNTFSLYPAINAQYTWITAEDYTSISGDTLDTQNHRIFILSPEIKAIKHINNGWYGTANIAYIMMHATNNNTTINNTSTINLNDTKHFEYSIGISKQFYNTNIDITVGRQDGDIYGWFGNINIKYIF